MIRAIIFDLDNTLIDREEAFLRFLTNACKRDLDSPIDNLLWLDDRGRGDRKVLFQELAQALPLGMGEKALWESFQTVFPAYFQPDSRVHGLLQSLLDSGMRMVILTNGGSRLQRGKIEHSGLEPFFDSGDIFISEESGFSKPDLRAFSMVIRHLSGIAPEEILMVGDQKDVDLSPAEILRMKTFHVEFFEVILSLPSYLNSLE